MYVNSGGRLRRRLCGLACAALLPAVLLACHAPVVTRHETDSVAQQTAAARDWQREGARLLVRLPQGMLALTPFLDGSLNIRFGPPEVIAQPAKSFLVLRAPAQVDWRVTEADDALLLRMPAMRVRIDRRTGALDCLDARDRVLLRAAAPAMGGATAADPHSTATVRQAFTLTPQEALYGLGQYRDNVFNWRGHRREMTQFNTQAAVPLLLSTQGYAILWDNPARTVFDDTRGAMSFTSDVGSATDYYVLAGERFDDLIGAYRELTGPAPLLPRWALGYIQSRNRYSTQAQLLAIASKQRALKLPMDAIFLDYKYWGKYGVGSHAFDAAEFPDPRGMIAELHERLHTQLVISVWPSFLEGTPNYAAMRAKGPLLPGVMGQKGTYYDPFNAAEGKLYWDLLRDKLLPLGIDGWFLDGPEAEGVNFPKATTAAGPGALVRNIYPLMHTANVYAGLRHDAPEQRAFLLTRCAWAGQQRNASAVWSGDIGTTFGELRRQITAGLNFCMAGIPYWTTDIGGYKGGDVKDPAFRELYTRWWEYGAFCPLFRSHGRREPFRSNGEGPNELWSFGDEVQNIALRYSNLRYRLMPYIYSLAGRVTREGYTMMRGLPFDFPHDEKALSISDEFMFGPAFLVCPVTTPGATQRRVYLPAGADWYDFWTGKKYAGGLTLVAAAPLDTMPLYVRAGSIVPLGPLLQYTGEKPADPIELRVYPGADGAFELYEDDGATYQYEQGAAATIPMTWNEADRKLTIGRRVGSFKGMLEARTLQAVWSGEGHGVGIEPGAAGDRAIHYAGDAVAISRQAAQR